MEVVNSMQLPHGQHDQFSDAQSFATVQIFLNAAVACIAHTRELIPWVSRCFQKRYASQLTSHRDRTGDFYKDFCALPTTVDDGSQEFRFLVRGQDRRADNILDFIEGGVSDALTHRYLGAFQLFVAADKTDPASIFETYTFSFSYDQGQVSSVSVNYDRVRHYTVKSVQRSFTTSIRALLRILTDLPRLPRRRCLGISLLYNDDCPSDYQAKGFLDIQDYQPFPMRGSWSDLWHIQPAPIAEFQAGCQKVLFGAQNLQYLSGMTCSRLQDVKMSKQIQELQKTSSQNNEIAPTANLPSTLLKGNTSVQATNLAATHADSPASEKVASAPVSAESRPSTRSINGLAKLSVASKNRRRRNVVASKLAELLVQARAMENMHRGTDQLFDSLQLQNSKVRRLDRDGPVKCECGSGHDSGQMLLCELCGKRQHKKCYGYDMLRQGCLPEEHFCYNCLLLPREDTINTTMPGIVHMRLALLFLANQPTGEVDIGQDFLQSVFGSRNDVAIEFLNLVDRLTEEGYLSQRSGGVSYILQCDQLLGNAQATYLDPLASISHHYQIIRDGDTFEKRKHETFRALTLYVGDRRFSLNDVTNSWYDRIHVQSNAGHEVIRWGFYTSWKRKRIDSLELVSRRQKVSIGGMFVNMNSSSVSGTMSMDDVLKEVVTETEWEQRLDGRLVSDDTDSTDRSFA